MNYPQLKRQVNGDVVPRLWEFWIFNPLHFRHPGRCCHHHPTSQPPTFHVPDPSRPSIRITLTFRTRTQYHPFPSLIQRNELGLPTPWHRNRGRRSYRPPSVGWPMETQPPPPCQLQRRTKWMVPLLASFFLSSLVISASLFAFSSSSISRSASLSQQALLLLSFSQIPNTVSDEPLFVESKLLSSSPHDAVPPRPVPRLAYLISGSAGDGSSLRRTLRALYHPNNQYVVHLDLEAPASERLEFAAAIRNDLVYSRFGNVRVIDRANMVTYRGPTMVTNTLHAASVLLKERGDWDWFINLSASDYPLVTQDGKVWNPPIILSLIYSFPSAIGCWLVFFLIYTWEYQFHYQLVTAS